LRSHMEVSRSHSIRNAARQAFEELQEGTFLKPG
jgi:hypothetical protein